jgi:hypothetical protein
MAAQLYTQGSQILKVILSECGLAAKSQLGEKTVFRSWQYNERRLRLTQASGKHTVFRVRS